MKNPEQSGFFCLKEVFFLKFPLLSLSKWHFKPKLHIRLRYES
jgi:hypothetical protein